MPWEASSRIGPLIGPADGKLLRALTSLEPGQSWLVEPKQLDDSGSLWRPGIRLGVQPGSEFHMVEYFGPVLGVMTAASLEDAIDMVNAVEYGLTSGLHSLDDDEIQQWLGQIEAGNLYVNRGITGAIVQRQPFGGWKRSVVGAGWKAGGPNYLSGLTRWADTNALRERTSPLPELEGAADAIRDKVLAAARTAGIGAQDLSWLANAVASDATAWAAEFGVVRDVTGLLREQNAFRYQAVPVTVRFEGTRTVELLRVVAAGLRAGSRVAVSAPRFERGVETYLGAVGVTWWAEDADHWASRLRHLSERGGRVRLVGADLSAAAMATDGSPDVALYDNPVVSAGRVELLPFLREQAVCITAHRFGTPRRVEVPALS
jgi:RHH-type proline utilization regulon transcriptional repressor/proline dehydrogenase/delta 1-pyrroline-5-carboxylate dehydrogenase